MFNTSALDKASAMFSSLWGSISGVFSASPVLLYVALAFGMLIVGIILFMLVSR